MDFLKILYFDYQAYLQPSDRTWLLLSLQLIYFLSYNKITNFHTELERIPYDQRTNSFITFATTLEQGFMEGDYSKVLQCKSASPSPHYEFFINRILDTIRHEIARSAEKAYSSLSFNSACQILMLGSLPELQLFVNAFCTSKEDEEIEWKVQEDRIFFIRKLDARLAEIPKWQLLTQAVNYAIELERIV
jgi:26S proteasome regulatory subunit N12